MHEFIQRAIALLESEQYPRSCKAIANTVSALSGNRFDSFDVRRALRLPAYELGDGGWRVKR